jgi:hypothetical protein
VLDPVAFPDDTVWSGFGRGYGYVPLALPVLGLLWLRSVGLVSGASELGTPDVNARDVSGTRVRPTTPEESANAPQPAGDRSTGPSTSD